MRRLPPSQPRSPPPAGRGGAATTLGVVALALVAGPSQSWRVALDAVAVLGLIAFVFLVLRAGGLSGALGGAAALGALGAALLGAKQSGALPVPVSWVMALLAAALVFGIGGHILRMAIQALRRGILNQHVLLEAAALAGLSGGTLGLVLGSPANYPTAAFFAVAVMVATYHIFSEWLSLIVKTRSSQAVKKLLDLQPATARVLREGAESEVPLETVALGEVVRVRPGESIPVDGEVLTPREEEVVKLVAEANTTKEIAEVLHLSEKTVENHRANAMRKLGMRDRVELALYALRHGLVVAPTRSSVRA